MIGPLFQTPKLTVHLHACTDSHLQLVDLKLQGVDGSLL